MKPALLLGRLAAAWRRGPALTIAWLLLGLWALGMVIASVQLGSWRQELSRTLLQLNADAQFRARLHNREAVDPEWYRRKALALLSATQRQQQDAMWTLFLPGSWHMFDPLEEQVQARLDREFGDIVVETVRRELFARTSQLTGVPLVRASGDLQAGADCQSPVPQNLDRKLTATAQDLPEFLAVADYVRAVERLDDAVQSYLALQYSGGQPEHLRKLVTYALDKDLPGSLAASVRMFHGGEEVNLQPALMQSRLQWATRCALAKAMSALHTRLLNTNDLFALEQALVERTAGLFDSAARPAPFDRTLERYRAVRALLDDQHALLSRGGNDWMREGTLKLGPAYQDVLQRIERTRLLGPEVLQQLNGQSGAAFAEFRKQFEQAFGSGGEPGVVWLDSEKRFGLSAGRAALRDGLAALLKTSFMADDANRAAAATPDNVPLAKVVEEARALAGERARVVAEIVSTFPDPAQPVVQRVVDARVSDLVYQRAIRTLRAALAADARAPIDRLAFGRQHDQVLALQGVLKETGGGALGDRLVATLDGELVRRLAALQDEWRQQPWIEGKGDNFAWWQGEPLSLAQGLGAGDTPAGTTPSLARTATRLGPLVQQAGVLLALGSPGLAADATAARWLQLQTELERYNARAADSSLVRLERYVAALGPDLGKDNCAQRLAVAGVAAGDDEIAHRHMKLHEALSLRCRELRVLAIAPAPAPSPAPSPAPPPAPSPAPSPALAPSPSLSPSTAPVAAPAPAPLAQ